MLTETWTRPPMTVVAIGDQRQIGDDDWAWTATVEVADEGRVDVEFRTTDPAFTSAHRERQWMEDRLREVTFDNENSLSRREQLEQESPLQLRAPTYG